MIRFLDGPAKGQTLMLRRAPHFLRVVMANGRWDALDQPKDTPLPGEQLYAYRRKGEAGAAFIDFSGKRRSESGLYASAEYIIMGEQPSQLEMQTLESWSEWCAKTQP